MTPTPSRLTSRAMVVPAVAAAAWLVLLAVGLCTGPMSIPADRLWAAMTGGEGATDHERLVLLHVRLPQMLLVGLVGAALAGSGAALQASFGNPLAEPAVLGVTGGASLAAALAVHLGVSDWFPLALPVCGFVGAMGAAVAVQGIAAAAGGTTGGTLLLTGLVVGTLCAAGVSMIMLNTADYRLQQIIFRLFGDFRLQSWEHVGLAAPGVVAGAGLLLAMGRPLDAMLLGEEAAAAVGVDPQMVRFGVAAAAGLAVGAATAAAGPVGFVGLMVPHLVRPLTGSSSGRLMPACLLAGAAFLTGCEILSRLASSTFILPVGVLTAAMGAPFFVAVLAGRARGSR